MLSQCPTPRGRQRVSQPPDHTHINAALAKIRQRLGSTNPTEAEEGTIRSLYGYDLMKNGAHASDSAENAERERKIVGLWKEGSSCETKELIDKFLADGGKRA